MTVYVRTCSAFDESNSSVCLSETYQAAYLIRPEDSTGAELFLSGGIDTGVIQTGFMGVITLFIAGLTIGLILKQLKQLR